MTLSKIIEQLKAADQNKSGMFELGEDVMCALVDLLERRERDKQEPVGYAFFSEVELMLTNRMVGGMLSVRKIGECPLYAAPPVATISNSADFAIDEVSHVTAPVVPDANYQQLSELYHAQEKRLFKIAQRIKGPSFDKYAYSPSQAIDVLEVAIFGESNDGSAAALNQTHVKKPASNGVQSFGNSEQLNSPVVPDGWIKCSERMPESKPGSYEYIVYETLNNRAHHDYFNVPDEGDNAFTPFWNHYGEYVTHWVPLPAAPKQESE